MSAMINKNHFEALQFGHYSQSNFKLILSMCFINGKAVCSEALQKLKDSRLESFKISVLTKHSSSRAGRAMTIISFLTSWVTNVTSPLSERS